jgi:molecular chaperone GrpE
MSDRRLVWATLAELITRLENAVTPLIGSQVERAAPPDGADNGVAALEKEVRKLGRTQFKANTLAEQQNTNIERVLEKLEADQQQQAEIIETLVAGRVAEAQSAWVQSLFPVLDGLDHAINKGQRYVVGAQGHTQAQFASWLKGVHLVRERLLALIKQEGVTPIPTVGHPFDPYLHIAVATTQEANNGTAPGTIVAEERRGYRNADDVLRFADVVVYRARPKHTQR